MTRSLHPLQDWVAHGDFNRRKEAPSLSGLNLWEQRHYWHNWDSPEKGSTGFPDDLGLDASGAEGRATINVMVVGTKLSNGDKTYWTKFIRGSKRINLTERKTRDAIKDFMKFVKDNGKPCGECQKTFLGVK